MMAEHLENRQLTEMNGVAVRPYSIGVQATCPHSMSAFLIFLRQSLLGGRELNESKSRGWTQTNLCGPQV